MHRSNATQVLSIAKVLTIGTITALAASVAVADDEGDKNLGRAFAEAKCASCHAIEPGAKSSPEALAPPFAQMITSNKLSVAEIEGWLVSSHKHMPAVTVPPEARADLVAYIKSLAFTK